ncbi:unnamed protein product [Hymenolepis diminuta]|uniref:Uncharacterized protein n=1 Tax=Hymenolepis diminuta TaxID=6216 RepID=A0A564YXZ0_HYMDI|nr:unnamed protein product [Hymenolepis diminuta]
MEPSKHKVVPPRLVSEPTVPKQQSVSKSCLLAHQTKSDMPPKGKQKSSLYSYLLLNS